MIISCKMNKRNILRYNSNDYLFNLEKINIHQYDSLAICFLSIRNFKMYNYMYGYEFGNKILNKVMIETQKCIDKQGQVYRFKGDILVITLYEIICKDKVKSIVESIIDIFNATITVESEKLDIMVSMGISMYPYDSKKIEDVFKYAEIAANNSMKNYINNYKFFQPDMYKNLMDEWKTQINILSAIKNGEYILYYQPQVDTKTNKIYGFEALIRWKHPQHGVLPPSYFIDIAEENGMINSIGRLVFQEACKEIKRWHLMGYNDLSISINVSQRQLEDDSFLDFIQSTLKKEDINTKYINIEITERVIVNPTDNILKTLIELRRRGIKIYIDDFGTKYSSLNYLYNIPIDGIKLDKTFIDRIHNVEKEIIITRNIIKLAREINLDVVAEGVEKKEQLDCLSKIDCHKIQGYVFGKPANSHEIEGYLKKFNQ